MRHIIIIPYDIASKLNPTFVLAKGLLKAGYRVTIVGTSNLKQASFNQNLPFVVAGQGRPLSGDSTDHNHPLKYLLFPSKKIDAAVDAMGMDQVPEILAQLDPDLILIDVEQHRYIISAVPTGIPVALLSTFVSLFKSSGLPPAHLKTLPGMGFKGSKLGMEVSWLRFRMRKLRQRLIARIKKKGLDDLSLLRHLARRTGFDFRKETTLHQWMIPCAYRRLPLLALMSREFDFPHSPPPHYHHGGALIDNARQEVVQVGDQSEEKELYRVMAAHKNRQPHKKLIYCSFGAFFRGNDIRFWKKLMKALGGHTQWTVIFGLGGRLEPSTLGPRPKNIHAFKWVPQLQVLEISDCAIIHGGISSINECILSGVPMLVFPFNVTDQHGAAARVVYHGVGIRGNRDGDTPRIIRNTVHTLLDETAYASAVKKMKEFFLRDLKENRAIKTVDELLSPKD